MTPKEALKWLDEHNTSNFMPLEVKAICSKALEKQIPKKPIEYYDGYADGNPVIEYECPNCGRDIEDYEHHCICGQAIDWSEEV